MHRWAISLLTACSGAAALTPVADLRAVSTLIELHEYVAADGSGRGYAYTTDSRLEGWTRTSTSYCAWTGIASEKPGLIEPQKGRPIETIPLRRMDATTPSRSAYVPDGFTRDGRSTGWTETAATIYVYPAGRKVAGTELVRLVFADIAAAGRTGRTYAWFKKGREETGWNDTGDGWQFPVCSPR